MTDLVASERAISFGPFSLLPGQRLLLEGDKPVRLGSRALDMLIALVEHPGEVVSRDELMARIWPNTHVDEGNLKFQISALRRTLGGGNRYLLNVPARGYSFVAPVARADEAGTAAPEPPQTENAHNLPALLTRLIGRGDTITRLAGQLLRQRLLTIVGAGGIGKTSVALAVAETLLAAYNDGVWLIDLAPLSDPRLVPSALAAVLSLEIRAVDPLPSVLASLRDKRMLLVLDNCEHVIDTAAGLAVAILRAAAGVHIVATSREPLRAEGERVYRLAPLSSPPVVAGITAADALEFTAVQLFVECAAAALGEFELSDADASVVAEICQKLDGIPLAIEFAAARVEAFGVHGLAAHLEERLRLLTSGRRAVLPRHQTMRAALDWSYQLLTEAEQRILRRLAIFAGSFTLDAAGAVAADPGQPESEIVDQVGELVTKSLVSADVGDAESRLRLLETTRAYALTKLAESGEIDVLAFRHAEFYRDLLETIPETSKGNDPASVFAREIDNIRAALSRAFAPGGDPAVGVGLAAASVPIWLETSLLTECHDWIEKALGALDAADRGTRREMVLQYALGYSLMFAQGMNDRARTALTRASELAERLSDLDYHLRALAGLAAICHRLQDYHRAVALGRRAEEAVKASSDPIALAIADWILGASLQLLGEYTEALTYAQRTYVRTAAPAVRWAHLARLGRDSFISAGSTVALIRWVQGLPDQAAETARHILADAEGGDHPVSLCLALTWCGCLIPLRLGELPTATRSIARLKDHAHSHGLSAYYANGLCFEGQLSTKQGDVILAEQQLRAGLKHLQQTQSETLYTVFLTGLAEVLMMSERLDESLVAADEAVHRTQHSNALWWMPEALRIKGQVLWLCKGDTKAAEDNFRRSLKLAHRQGALSWELRAATSLAGLLHDQGRSAEAVALLQPVYDRFAEGFGTADLQAAKQLLDELSDVAN